MDMLSSRLPVITSLTRLGVPRSGAKSARERSRWSISKQIRQRRCTTRNVGKAALQGLLSLAVTSRIHKQQYSRQGRICRIGSGRSPQLV
jgi:hypothetical protein